MIGVVLLFLLQFVCANARDATFPPMKLDFLHIKTPQLIGIIAGCIVFSVTIGVVIYLLFASGSLSKLLVELQTNQPLSTKKESDASPQFQTMPELYEHLLLATTTLPVKPNFDECDGKFVSLRAYDDSVDRAILFLACNGAAQYDESAYDPARIWGWLDSRGSQKSNKSDDKTLVVDSGASSWPSASATAFNNMYSENSTPHNALHLVIVDKELSRQIGMVSLVDNDPRNLTIKIDNLWITPAFQGKQRSHDAVLQVLTWLVNAGYRRISAEVDERHVIGRRFLESCGFELEAVLRKHKVIQRRNRNTAVYVVLNSEWLESEAKLKRRLGYSLKPAAHKVAEIESGKDIGQKKQTQKSNGQKQKKHGSGKK